jgi:hypothetical protein
MRQIPETENPLVLRTDFSNQTAWEAICKTIREPIDGFYAYVEFVDEAEYAGLTKAQLLALIPDDYAQSFIIIADQSAISQPDHPLLIIDLYEGSGEEFRAIPSQIQAIENNLSIANMDFEEFAEAVDEKGVFRGFPRL